MELYLGAIKLPLSLIPVTLGWLQPLSPAYEGLRLLTTYLFSPVAHTYFLRARLLNLKHFLEGLENTKVLHQE